MKTYHLSAAGRRTAIILLVGALVIWAFALWTFGTTIAGADQQDDLSVGRVVTTLLMLVLIVATPLMVWNIFEEWAATYQVVDEGLRFRSLGIELVYPWTGVQAINRLDADSDEPMDEIVLTEDFTGQIRNPILRFLHAQAYGRKKLPIYDGLADRDELLDEIRRRAGLPDIESQPATESV